MTVSSLETSLCSSLASIARTIRCLSIDAIEKAGSGHPGLPLGCADIGAYLFAYAMHYNPKDPHWIARDRFILSAGHGSMLLYSCLHLAGYSISLEDLQAFRQLDSKTPGHPEYAVGEGVETTTGPLGQGVGHGIGQALGLKILEQHCPLISPKVYVLASDGDIMEGISAEACSLAGHWGLDNLVLIYDSNQICLDGPLEECFSEEVMTRYQAYGWEVHRLNGHDFDSIHAGFSKLSNQDKPLLLVCNTTIGKGSPNKAGSHKVHGAPLGEAEVALTKASIGAEEKPFFVSEEVKLFFDKHLKKQEKQYEKWQESFQVFQKENPQSYKALNRLLNPQIPHNLEELMQELSFEDMEAGRQVSAKLLQLLSKNMPHLIGGSADLSCSDKSFVKEEGVIAYKNFSSRNIKYGIREFAMASISTGLAQSASFLPYCATFLVFSDYMRNAIRLSALMKLRVIYIFTHDSIFVGEDGPTHQPIEHYASLRAIPQLQFFRPADAKEVQAAYLAALNYQGPTAIALSRQSLPLLEFSQFKQASQRGGYILKKGEGQGQALRLFASGSETHLALSVAEELDRKGYSTTLVSMPCWELFFKQPLDYQKQVIGEGKKIAVEAGVCMGWHRFIGSEGRCFSIEEFGRSAPGAEVAQALGLYKDNIVNAILKGES